MPGKSPGAVANHVRVMIVDASPVVRQGLHTVIIREPDLVVCGQASGCAEALRLAEATRPDVIIVAISLGDGSGLRLIKRIKARTRPVRFLVFSCHDENLFAERALRAGALGFIEKRRFPAADIQRKGSITSEAR